MARVTKERRAEIQRFLDKWEPFCENLRGQNIRVNAILLSVAIGIIKELLDE